MAIRSVQTCSFNNVIDAAAVQVLGSQRSVGARCARLLATAFCLCLLLVPAMHRGSWPYLYTRCGACSVPVLLPGAESLHHEPHIT